MSRILIRPMEAGEEELRDELAYQSYKEYAQGDPNHHLAQRALYGFRQRSDPRMKPECNRLLFCDDKMVSSITVYLWPIRFHGGDILAGLIGGVCTHPDHRRRGYIRMLMEDAKNFMRDEGVTLSWLYGKQSVYGPCGYDTFNNYSILEAENFPKPEPGLTLRPLELAHDYASVKKIHETWNANAFGPTVRLEGDWKKHIFAEKSEHGGIAHFYTVVDKGGRMIAYCHMLPDNDHSIGEFGALDEKSAARALPVIAREVGGHIRFGFDHANVENGAKLANAKIGRKQNVHGMWLVINGSRLGLPDRATHAELFSLLQNERFIYYSVDHF